MQSNDIILILSITNFITIGVGIVFAAANLFHKTKMKYWQQTAMQVMIDLRKSNNRIGGKNEL